MSRTLDFIFAIAFLLLAVGSISWLVRRVWRKLPEAPEYRDPLSSVRQGKCDHCAEPPSRYAATIVEHRSWAELLSKVIPIGMILPRLRRTTAWTAVPTKCELHASIAEGEIDLFLAEDARELAQFSARRSKRARTFIVETLPKVLSGEG